MKKQTLLQLTINGKSHTLLNFSGFKYLFKVTIPEIILNNGKGYIAGLLTAWALFEMIF